MPVFHVKFIETNRRMLLKGLLQHLRLRVHHRKVELQNQVAVPFRRWVATPYGIPFVAISNELSLQDKVK